MAHLRIRQKLDTKINIAAGAHLAPSGSPQTVRFPEQASPTEAVQKGFEKYHISEIEQLNAASFFMTRFVRLVRAREFVPGQAESPLLS